MSACRAAPAPTVVNIRGLPGETAERDRHQHSGSGPRRYRRNSPALARASYPSDRSRPSSSQVLHSSTSSSPMRSSARYTDSARPLKLFHDHRVAIVTDAARLYQKLTSSIKQRLRQLALLDRLLSALAIRSQKKLTAIKALAYMRSATVNSASTRAKKNTVAIRSTPESTSVALASL